MKKLSIEIMEDQFLIKLARENDDLSSLYTVLSNLRSLFVNPSGTSLNDTNGDIRSRIDDGEESSFDYLEDK